MTQCRFHLGIDLGSISLKIVLLGTDHSVRFERWVRVAGRPLPALETLLGEAATVCPDAAIASIGVTGSGRSLVAEFLGATSVNEITAHAAAAAELHPEIRTIIEIGGQDSKLIVLGESKGKGRRTRDETPTADVREFAMNELCAAGTGAFLDQQAARLGLPIEAFAALALEAREAAPIAGRCAVFAKTDMTHHQQEGRPLAEIVAGLNEALARSYLGNLVRGRELPRPIAFQGGVAANPGLVAAFRQLLGLSEDEFVVPSHHKVMGAVGAALISVRAPRETPLAIADAAGLAAAAARDRSKGSGPQEGAFQRLTPPAEQPLEPDFSALSIDGTYLGIDVGSVSVKLAAIGAAGLVFSDYRFSDGRPLEVLAAMLSELAATRPDLVPQGVGVTGSGRDFVGALINADAVQNEITAQAVAAALILPGCDTVVEIGGQDAKFLRLEGGRPAHFAMNRVCAAGTGAFLQEQAVRLEIDLARDFAAEAFSSERPADLGARCTVFMESDLVAHQQQGFARRDIVAGLARSVITNYCEKVVSGHPTGERVLFLGGVAENRAVVAALEARLGMSVATSTVGRLSGAIGAAAAALEARRAGIYQQSRCTLDAAALAFTQFVCEACPNRCHITETASTPRRRFGGRCGRYDAEARPRPAKKDSLLSRRNDLIFGEVADRRSPITDHRSPPFRVGIPRALLTFDQFPAWRTYFESLGCEVVLSPPTDSELLSGGMKHLVVETCLPVKAFCAHLRWLEERGVDAIFVPSLVVTGRDLHDKETAHCPYVQGLAAIARPIVATPLLDPVINWKLDPASEAREMAALALRLGSTRHEGRRAWRAAVAELQRVRAELRRLGAGVLEKLSCGKVSRAFVLLGKDYNVNDGRLSSNAAELLEARGEVVLTQDMIVDDAGAYSAAYRTMSWSHGKEILAAAEIAAQIPGLIPVMVTSFGCGPDSSTIGFLRDTLRDKPLLLLEVDEHSSAVGIETRVEAFLDSLRGAPPVRTGPARPAFVAPDGIRRVFLPNFSAHGYAFAASVRTLGLAPVLTPLPDEESARLGAAHVVSGECHPYVLMLGDYLKVASGESDLADACYFMPESGSCRVGQFGAQMRLAAERAGVTLPIFTRIEDVVAAAGGQPHGSWLRAIAIYWQMMRGMDFLVQMHLERRAREIEPGSADRANALALQRLHDAIQENRPLEGLRAARDCLAAVPIDRSRKLMRIGITGDYYTRICDFANAELFREIERLGGVVMIPPTMSEFVKYDMHYRTDAALKHRSLGALAQALVLRGVVPRLERKVRAIFAQDLDYDVPLEFERARELIRPYIDARVPAGLAGSVAAILEQLRAGADGIVSAITFHCTYGLVVGSALAGIDRDWPDVPKLTLIYEGLKPTHNRLRLEAFMERARARATEKGRSPC